MCKQIKLIIQNIKVYVVIDPEKSTNLKMCYVLNYLQSVTCRGYTSVQASICLSIYLEAFQKCYHISLCLRPSVRPYVPFVPLSVLSLPPVLPTSPAASVSHTHARTHARTHTHTHTHTQYRAAAHVQFIVVTGQQLARDSWSVSDSILTTPNFFSSRRHSSV